MEKTLKLLEGGVKSAGSRFIYTKVDGDKVKIPKQVPPSWYRFQPPNLPQLRPTDFAKLFETVKEGECSYIAPYHGDNSPMGPNIYGGLIYAQALAAAQKEVDSAFRPTSFHGLFIGPSHTQKPMRYDVKKLRDGRSFSARYVEGLQDGKVVFAALGNFYKPFPPSMIHTIPMPKVPPPEQCLDMYDFVEQALKSHHNGDEVLDETALTHIQRRYFDKETNITDFRLVNPRAFFFIEPFKNVPIQFWFKTRTPLTDPKLPEIIHQLIISYVSDQCMATSNVGPHLSHGHEALVGTSLDHTLWFHNFDFRADEWMFLEAQSPNADSGTAYGQCSIWTKDGKHIASGGQESMARLKTVSKL